MRRALEEVAMRRRSVASGYPVISPDLQSNRQNAPGATAVEFQHKVCPFEVHDIGLRSSKVMLTHRSTVPEGYGHRIFSSIKKKSERRPTAAANDRIISPQRVSFELRLDEIKDEEQDSKQAPTYSMI